MKKNIKFVGAAAAALLAVAPVVASPAAANAAVSVNNATATQPTQTAGTVTVNASLTATAGETSVADAQKSIKVSVDGANLANTSKDNWSAEIVDENGNAVTTTNLEPNQAYRIKISNLKLSGLTTGETYTIAGGSFDDNQTSMSASDLMNGTQTFTTDSFYVFDYSLTGNPYVVKSGSYVTKGEVKLGNNLSVNSLASAITNVYSVSSTTTGNAEGLDFSPSAVKDAVRAALKSANVKVNDDAAGSFKAPATNFTVNLTAYASNGNTVNFPVTVTVPNATVASDAPVISLNAGATANKNGKYSNVKDTSATLTIANTGALINANTIASDFSAVIKEGSNTNTEVNVKSSNLNPAVAGNYTVVLTATNPSGKTTDFTVNVTVGDPGKTATVQAGSDTATVVTINGNTVTPTDTTLANGSEVATYGTVTVDGTSYTRLNSSDSNKYVETQYVNGSIKEEETVEKTVMHNAYYYNSKGEHIKDAGKAYSYHAITVVKDPVTINGASYYKIPGKDRYIKASNIDGTKRTLDHNAYIYSSKGKRLKKNGHYLATLKKGAEVTTYGGSYNIKQNGVNKPMYRIAPGQYVKVSNFR